MRINFVCGNFRQRNRPEICSLVTVYVGNLLQRRKQTIGVQRRAPPAQWHCVAIDWSCGWGQRNGGWLAG